MTLLHSFRGRLQEDRTELYANAVDLLLRRWESRLGENNGLLEQLAIPGLKVSDLEEGLYNVAFRAHSRAESSRDTADIDEADLRKWLAPYLGKDWNKAGKFASYIRERAGLLIQYQTESYTFPHRTFQEFLAACHLVGVSDYPREAAQLVRDDLDRWREVFVLAAGYAARTHRLGQAIAAVNALCPREAGKGKPLDAVAVRRAQLVGDTLCEIGLIGVQREEAGLAVLERVRDWLVTSVQADNLLESRSRSEAGKVLARLGDPRFKTDAWYLPNEPLLGFIEVPAGPFLMGNDGEQSRDISRNESPQHTIELPTYYVSRYPVTVAQFRAFAQSRRYQAQGSWQQYSAFANHPVVAITWSDAIQYCEWLTKRLREWKDTPEPLATLVRDRGWTVRLLTEAQWEKAARGTDGRTFPWGNDPDPNRANYGETGIGTTSTVGCFPSGASPYGCLDMAGNVWEWTHTLWGKDYESSDFKYPYSSNDGREPKWDKWTDSDTLRVLRGGSFLYQAALVRCSYRFGFIPDFWLIGFRVAIAPYFDSGY
jgi:formylglycine-generating enzyme required for sulfatase activity